MDIKQEAEEYIKTSTMVSFKGKRHIKNLLKELEATERKLAKAENVARNKALDEVIAIMENTIHVMTDIEIVEAIEELKSDYEASKEYTSQGVE